jgi:hypothetical protein
MAATLLLSPPRISFNQQEMLVKISTDRIDYNNQAKVSLAFSSQNNPAEGDVLTISWGLNTVVFTFKNTMTGALDLPVFNPTQGFYAAYLMSIAERIGSHSLIIQDWAVGLTGQNIRLISKLSGAIIPIVSSTSSAITATATVATALYLVENLSAYLHCTDIFGVIFGAALNVPYDTKTQVADFDIQTIFADLQPHLPLGSSMAYDAQFRYEVAQKSIKAYRFQYADKSGTPPKPQNPKQSDVHYAVFGNAAKFPESDFAVVCHPIPTIRKQLGLRQPEFGYVYIMQDFPECFVELTLYLDDGTTLLWLPNGGERFYLTKDLCGIFQTGYAQLALEALNLPLRIVAYDWRLMHDNNLLHNAPTRFSELAALRYDVDYQTAINDIHIIFDNGMGGMETLRLRGFVKEKYTVEMTEVEYADGARDTFGEEITTTYEVSTVVMPTDLCRYYRQLLKHQMWLCDLKSQKFVKILRVTKEIELNPNIPYNVLKFAFQLSKKS